MPIYELPKELTPGFSTKTKPTVPVVIDYSNPIARGLVTAIEVHGGNLIDYAGGAALTKGSAYELAVDELGVSNNHTDTINSIVSFAMPALTTGVTIFYKFKGANTSNVANCASGTWPSGWILGPDDGDRAAFFYNGATTSRPLATGLSLNDGKLHSIAGTWRQNGTSYLYLDGEEADSSTTAMTTWTGGSTVEIGNRGDSEIFAQFDGTISCFLIFDRQLTDLEIRSLDADPYQIFKPAIPHVFFSGVAAAPPPAVTEIPPRLHLLDSQFSTITAHRLGGVLEQ